MFSSLFLQDVAKDVSSPVFITANRGRSSEKNVPIGWAQSFEIPDKVYKWIYIIFMEDTYAVCD